jgi:hypothetical protein
MTEHDPRYGRHAYRNEPGQAYTLTCDSGHCEELTQAVVLGIEGVWLSMCVVHARQELAVL